MTLGARLSHAVVRAVAWVFAGYVVATTCAAVALDSSPVWYWDQWFFAQDVFAESVGESPWSRLWHQHNEHRIVSTRLLLHLDSAWAGGTGDFARWVHVGLQVLLSFAMCWLIVPRALRSLWLPCGLATTFSATQLINYLWAFQSQFAVVALASSCAFLLFERAIARGRNRWSRWAVAMLLGGWGAVSMGHGMIVFPVLVLLALLRGRVAIALATTCCMGVVVAAYFGLGYEFAGLALGDTPAEPFWLGAEGALLVLASPIRSVGRSMAIVVTLLACLGFAVVVLRWLRTGRLRGVNAESAACRGVFAVTVFVVVSAAATGFVRRTENFALTDRYSGLALWFWFALAVACGMELKRWFGARPSTRPWLAAVPALLLLLCLVSVQSSSREELAWWVRAQHATEASLVARVEDPELWSEQLRLNGGFVPPVAALDFLRMRRLSVFADGRHFVVGSSLTEQATVRPGESASIRGSLVEQVSVGAGDRAGLRLRGTLECDTRRPPAWIYITDRDLVIRGLARVVDPSWGETSPVAFVGHVLREPEATWPLEELVFWSISADRIWAARVSVQ